jgi:hypothetical protein
MVSEVKHLYSNPEQLLLKQHKKTNRELLFSHTVTKTLSLSFIVLYEEIYLQFATSYFVLLLKTI